MEEEPAGHPPDSVREVESDEAFDDVVESEDRVLVDFYADWCGPCRTMAPRVEAIAAETDVAVLEVNVEEAPTVGHRFDVRSLPTFLGFREGAVVGRLVGVQSRDNLEELLS